jgi:hypothetical protein
MPLWFTVTLIVTGVVVATGLVAYLIDRSNHV